MYLLQITDTYRYDAFGSQLNTITAPNPFQYCGEYLDSENGNYYLRARNYVPDLGRFTQWDSYAGEIINPISLNHYVYCYNDPIGLRDPSGNIPVETTFDLISAGASFLTFMSDPTWGNFGYLIVDGVAVAAPYIPGSYALKAASKVDDVTDVIKVADKSTDVLKIGSRTAELSKKNIQHIKKHTYEGIAEQAKYLTDEQLIKKLNSTTFFNKEWSQKEVERYTQKAYNILLGQGKTGTHSVKVAGEIITVVIKEDGTFDTAYGVYKFTVRDFKQRRTQ